MLVIAWALVLSHSLLVRFVGSRVIELTGKNFEHRIENSRYTLVKFFSPTCGHCQELAPKYEKASEELKGIPVARVDVTQARELLHRYDVKEFPTIYWFENDPEVYYAPEKPLDTVDSIVRWALFMASPAVKETEKLGAPGSLPSVVLYAESLLDSFEAVARQHRPGAVWRFVKRAGSPTVSIRHRGAAETGVNLTLSASTQNKEIADFFSQNKFPAVGRLDSDNFETYMEAMQGLIWILLPMNVSDGDVEAVAGKYHKTMQQIARAVIGKYLVIYTDTTEFKETIKHKFAITSFPAAIIQKRANSKQFFTYRRDINSASVLRLLSLIDVGKVEAESKSEPVPKKNSGPVRRVVGKTLQREVFLSDKDVLLEVYAPWCNHCKKLEPEYAKLSKRVAELGLTDYVKIANMDGTANDSPVDSITWEGFPTIYLCKAGVEMPLLYEGTNTAKDLWDFLLKEGSNMYEMQDHLDRLGRKMEL